MSRPSLLALAIAAAGVPSIAVAQEQPVAAFPQQNPKTLDAVVVSGRVRSLEQFTQTGSRLNLSARETPASLDSINGAAMEARGLQTVEKAAESLPGINTGGSPGNPATFSMRGFTDGQITILHNGLYLGPSNMTNRPQNTFNLQSVEVLKGPASVIYGQGAVGGAVNVTNKAPTFGPAQYEVMAGLSRFGGRQAGFGAGGGLSDSVAYRFDVSHLSSDGYVHGADSSALNATFSMLWRPSEDFSAQVSVDYANDKPTTYFGTPLVPAATAKEPISGLLTSPNGYVIDHAMRDNNYNVADANIAAHQIWPQVFLKWKLGEFATLQNLSYYFRASRRWINSESYVYDTDTAQIERDRFFVFHEQRLWGNQTSLTINRPVGGLENRFIVGLDYSNLDFVRDRGFPGGDSVDPYSRGPSGSFGDIVRRRSPTQWKNIAVFFEDALDLTEQLKLVTGGRYEKLDLDRKNYGPDGSYLAATSFSQTYKPTNVRIGLVYDVTPNITPYLSYSTGTDPVGSNIFIVNAGEDFALSKSRQIEAGVKVSTSDHRLSGTLAVYDIKRENILALTQQDVLSNIGSQTSRGIELSGDALLTSQWSLNANYAYTDAEYGEFLDSNTGLDASGNTPTNVPQSILNTWTSVREIGGLPLEAGVGARRVGTRYGNIANTLKLGSYVLTNAYVNYDVTSAVSLSLHVENLTNKDYVQWADIYYPGQVILGEPRSYELSLHARF